MTPDGDQKDPGENWSPKSEKIGYLHQIVGEILKVSPQSEAEMAVF